MLTQEEWLGLPALTGAKLKEKVFLILQKTAMAIQVHDRDDPEVLSVVPRLAELVIEREELHSFKEAFNSLARAVGLWNYIDRDSADAREEFIAEAVTVPELDGITLHREQISALNRLFSGQNLILSAPTSFGKSILVDALLASAKYRRVAIVLPTIALLDEFRRRLAKRFANKFQIVMYHSEDAPKTGNVIFLGTQERLVNRNDLGHLDLSVIDEFYKLDPTRQDDRSLVLNAAVYQLLRRSTQFFFLGPNIDSIRFSSDRWEFSFLRTRFLTVAVDTFDLRGVKDRDACLMTEVRSERNWPALVFVSAPDRANQLATKIAEGPSFGNGEEFASWIEENFGRGWEVAAAVRKGIGLHHGRIPRAVASHLIRLFNSRDVPVLLCTSTLIEGVNTAAKSVLIYDKAINRENFDFFTFSNIRGRAGRLGEHHVGSVYLFHPPPKRDTIEVQAPLFENLDDAPDELVVHLSDGERTPSIDDRIQNLRETLGLTAEQLRVASAVGLDVAAALRDRVRTASTAGARIHWAGYPRYEELKAVCQVICTVKRPMELGAFSAPQLTLYINRLMKRGTMQTFFRWHSESQEKGQSRDGIFRFLRACEYGLPQLFAVAQMFAEQLDARTDYSYLVGELPRWFRPEAVKNLDEQGIPIQIGERFYIDGDTLRSLSERLAAAAQRPDPRLSPFEQRWVSDSLLT